ncbi:hypothetical protein [Psychroflexus planctonicus]|uniref:Uncharacterized protein n=1 Tax=Psychroflexus planctonicus TaxID=1526575 RepID=A0ABQ1SF34_9FLAO|nr:hypothetical protein [Psychroflexus planctonicus]GGE29095.1 hypothetical protein GCM10010832_07120 [Psychroflexus planctonicus]
MRILSRHFRYARDVMLNLKTKKLMIEQNSSTSEMNSPYFVRNKEFCNKFENFVLEKNGKVKGIYNAWSFSVIGKIKNPNIWTLNYKKSTFTSGNLFLSTKTQNLLTSAEWKTKNIFESNFKVRRKMTVDFFNLQTSKSLSKLDFSDKYVIDIKIQKGDFLDKLFMILKPLFLTNEIYEIENSKDDFRIELRTEKHHFEIFERVAELKKTKHNSA